MPESPLELPGITLHPLSFAARSAKFDLDLALTDAADRLSGVLDYNADLFDATTMERFLAHLEQLLARRHGRPGAAALRAATAHRR